MMSDNLHASFENGVLTIQRAQYIEDGWYIEYSDQEWRLFEIPEFGGDTNLLTTSLTFDFVYAAALGLT